MREWVLVTNPETFKMTEALVAGETLDWPTFGKFKFAVGDMVFFYASSPTAQMIGKLEIEELGLRFSEVEPRNELRKWPKRFSNIPWMRLRVLQSAPVPFKPLQSRSLYYHTGFKPSPYPKLLHAEEREYVYRAFNEAMTYTADSLRYEGGLNPTALSRIERGEMLAAAVDRYNGGEIEALGFDKPSARLTLTLRSADGSDRLTIECLEIIRAQWDYDSHSCTISGIRLDLDTTYLLLTIDSASVEILTTSIRIN